MSKRSPKSLTEWFEFIRPDFVQGNVSIIAGATKLIEAKKALKGCKSGFTQLVAGLGMGLDKAERLMVIARHPVLSDSAHARTLPLSWMTQFTLAKISPGVLAQLIADGTVHPGLERQEAKRLVERTRGQNSTNGNGANAHADGRGDDGGDYAGDRVGDSDEHHGDGHGDDGDGDGGDQGGDRDVNIDSCAGAEPKPEDASPAQPTTRDITVGPDSPGEIQRKLARLEELERENRRLAAYEREFKERALKGRVWDFTISLIEAEDDQITMALFGLGFERWLECSPPSFLEELETRFSEHRLGTLRLVDLLERRLERDDINATAQLQKIRKQIEQLRPQIDLSPPSPRSARRRRTPMTERPAPNRSGQTPRP